MKTVQQSLPIPGVNPSKKVKCHNCKHIHVFGERHIKDNGPDKFKEIICPKCDCSVTLPVTDHGRSIFVIIALILLACWVVGVFSIGHSPIIHTLLIVAIIALILRVMQGSNSRY